MVSKKDYVKKWCELALVRTKNINTRASSSYGLKHYCEQSIGVYVSNQEIIEVMEELGFIKQRCNGVNYQFNISKIPDDLLMTQEELQEDVAFMNLLGDILTHIIEDAMDTGKYKLGKNDKPTDTEPTVHE